MSILTTRTTAEGHVYSHSLSSPLNIRLQKPTSESIKRSYICHYHSRCFPFPDLNPCGGVELLVLFRQDVSYIKEVHELAGIG